jgi:hypothetical protein
MKKLTLSFVLCLSLCGCAHAGYVSTTELNAAINGVIANFTGPTNGTTAAAVTNIVVPIVQSATNNALATATNSFMPIGTAIPTTNGLATTNYVNAATNNFGRTIPVNMTNGNNTVSGTLLYPSGHALTYRAFGSGSLDSVHAADIWDSVADVRIYTNGVFTGGFVGSFTGNGSGLTNHLAFATNTPVVVYGHVTNGLCTWTTSP